MDVLVKDAFLIEKLETDARVMPVSAETIIAQGGGFESDFEWDSYLEMFTCSYSAFKYWNRKIQGARA